MSILLTLPTHLSDPRLSPEIKDIMLGMSEADNSHDIADPTTNEYFRSILDIIYRPIQIFDKDYGEYTPDHDPFTKSIDRQTMKCRLNNKLTIKEDTFEGFNISVDNDNGPVPRVGLHAFMKRFYIEDSPSKTFAVVADNVTSDCLKKYLDRINTNHDDVKINEIWPIASVIDMGSRHAPPPPDWGISLYNWWEANISARIGKMRDNKEEFSIDLTAIGAVRIPTILTVKRNLGADIITVILNVAETSIQVSYNLTKPLNTSLMLNDQGTHIFFLGKGIAVEFFKIVEEYKKTGKKGNKIDVITKAIKHEARRILGKRRTEQLINQDIKQIFAHYSVHQIAIILPIVKLIGDLLFPLCSPPNCIDLSTDKLLICRCIAQYVDSLLKYSFGNKDKSTYVDGFYFFKRTLDAVITKSEKSKEQLYDELLPLESVVTTKKKAVNILIEQEMTTPYEQRYRKRTVSKHIQEIYLDMLNDKKPRSKEYYIDMLNQRLIALGVVYGGNQNINIKLIKVKWNRNTYEVDVTLSDNVLSLKDKLFSLTGVSPDKQKLILAGKTLKNDASLESSNIKQGSVLLMIGVVDVEKKVDTHTTPPPNINKPDKDENGNEHDDVEHDEDENGNDNFLHATKSYTSCVIEEVEIFIDVLKKILENSEKILFILKNGNKPTQLLPDGFRNFIGFLKSFLEESIKKLKDRQVLIGLYNTDDVIASLETILNITTKMFIVVEDKDTGNEIYYYVPYNIPYDDIIIDISLLLDINLPEHFDSIIADININETKQDDEGTPSMDILLLGNKDIIIRRLVTYILDNIENNKEILEKELPKIYDLLKGKDIETIVSKNNINPLYFSIMPSVLSIMNSYNVFKEDVELELIRAIVQNNKEFLPGINEHKILTDSIYSLYRNMTGLYGVYVYDIEIIKSFIEGINLQNNRLEFVGGFRSFQTIIDIRCNTDLEKMNNDSETYVSLSHVIKQISNIVDFIINKLHENNISENEISTMSKDKLKGYIDNFLKTIEKHQPEQQQQEQQQPQQQFNPLELQHGNIFSVPNAVPVYGGKNNPKSKHNAKYRKKYKKFVSKYIIKKNKKQNKTKNKSTHTTKTKNKTKKNKKIAKNKSNYTKKTLKNKNKKRNHKSNHKSKHNKNANINYYNLYKHNKTLKH
jgi:hypothetical protein